MERSGVVVPQRSSWRLPNIRYLFGAGLLIMGAGIAAVSLMFVAPVGSAPHGTLAGKTTDFPLNTVTYVPKGHFFVVHNVVGLRALSELSPEHIACPVRYRPPDTNAGGTTEAAVVQAEPYGGYFRGACGGRNYSWWRGENLDAAGGLFHFDIQVDGGNVFVDTSVPRIYSPYY